MIAASSADPATGISFVSRFTTQEVTPGSFETARSTRAEQAEQCMPEMENRREEAETGVFIGWKF